MSQIRETQCNDTSLASEPNPFRGSNIMTMPECIGSSVQILYDAWIDYSTSARPPAHPHELLGRSYDTFNRDAQQTGGVARFTVEHVANPRHNRYFPVHTRVEYLQMPLWSSARRKGRQAGPIDVF